MNVPSVSMDDQHIDWTFFQQIHTQQAASLNKKGYQSDLLVSEKELCQQILTPTQNLHQFLIQLSVNELFISRKPGTSFYQSVEKIFPVLQPLWETMAKEAGLSFIRFDSRTFDQEGLIPEEEEQYFFQRGYQRLTQMQMQLYRLHGNTPRGGSSYVKELTGGTVLRTISSFTEFSPFLRQLKQHEPSFSYTIVGNLAYEYTFLGYSGKLYVKWLQEEIVLEDEDLGFVLTWKDLLEDSKPLSVLLDKAEKKKRLTHIFEPACTYFRHLYACSPDFGKKLYVALRPYYSVRQLENHFAAFIDKYGLGKHPASSSDGEIALHIFSLEVVINLSKEEIVSVTKRGK